MVGMRRALVLLLVLMVFSLAGCLGEETLKDYRRADTGDAAEDGDDDIFTFSVPKGTDRLKFVASTKGSPASTGSVEFIVVRGTGQSGASGIAYMNTLPHGAEDVGYLDDPEPGTYTAIVEYNGGYSGPASMHVARTGGAGPLGIGGSFWDILGVVLAAATLTGGWFLYRHHTSKLNREMERIDETFRELRADVVACRAEFVDMQEDLRRQLVQRRLKESHYLILEKRIERHLADLERLAPAPVARDDEVLLEME